ncbi:hypothetical protein J4Q44_G00334730 [Coregonus suidteri]|uniref:Bleomycin hydrolase n=1 Tax=Coregonus suidteri TaxID=861788 RepID=A0AAN8Q8Y7_9TELE
METGLSQEKIASFVKRLRAEPRYLLAQNVSTCIDPLEQDEKDGGYEKWRVENSWGDDRGNKGYLIMTDEWFSEYVYEVVVDKKYLAPEVLEVMQKEPIVLPAWDPMGALAL